MGFDFYQIGVIENFPLQIQVDVENLTVKQFVKHLSEQYSRDIEGDVFDYENQLKNEYLFILNGVNISDGQGLDTVISKDSELLLTVLMYGG